MTFDDGRDRDRDRDGETGRSGILPESLRKAVATGLSAIFMTEEGIRNLLSDVRMPKDAVAYLLQQTDKSRRELFRIIAEELKTFLKSADLPGEMRRALTGLRMEVKAEVRFVDERRRESKFSAKFGSGSDAPDDDRGGDDRGGDDGAGGGAASGEGQRPGGGEPERSEANY